MFNMLGKRVRLWSVVAAICLGGCTSIDLEIGFLLDEDIHRQILDQASDSYPEIDTLYISDEIEQLVDGHLNRRDNDRTKVNKLQEILYDEEFLNIQYSDEQTLTAVEAYLTREGNCLSVMNLYVAMARYAGLEASFQTVNVQPNWDRRGSLLVLSQHINATGKLAINSYYVVDFTSLIALQ